MIARDGRARRTWSITAGRAVLAALLALAGAGCASGADPEATRRAWEEHDRQLERECGGRVISGVCIRSGGGA
jgi:hypothetical protein